MIPDTIPHTDASRAPSVADDHVRRHRPGAPARRVLCLALFVGVALCGGCEDQDSARRAEAQRKIDQASRTLERVMLTGVPDEDGAAGMTTGLQSIIRDLASLPGAAPGQVSAAATIAATAGEALGELPSYTLEAAESGLALDRGHVHTIIDNATRLAGLATGATGVDFARQREALSAARSEADRARTTWDRERAQLRSPIEDHERRNREDGQRVTGILGEAGTLRRTATDAGARAGFPTFQQAVTLERNADRIAMQIAEREAELSFVLRPEFTYVAAQADASRDELESIDLASGAIEKSRTERERIAAAARRQVQVMRTRLDEVMSAMAATREEADAALSEALAAFDAAARAAQTAARGGARETAAARLIGIRVEASAARVTALRAASLAADAAVFRRLAEAGTTFGDAAAHRRAADDAERRSAELMASARERLTSAREAIGQVSRPEAEEIARMIDQAQTLAGGRPAPAAPAVRGPAGSGAAPATEGAGGADSPQSLVDAANAILATGSPNGLLTLARAAAETDRRALTEAIRANAAMERVAALASEHIEGFDPALLAAMQGAVAAGATVELIAADEREGTIRLRLPEEMAAAGGDMEIPIRATDEGWFVDAAGLLQAVVPAGWNTMEVGDLYGRLRRGLDALARRLESGAITTFDAFAQEFAQTVMRVMSSG